MLAALLLLFAAAVQASQVIERQVIEDFTTSEGWEEQSFEGQTRYSLQHLQGRSALLAECAQSASGLYWKRDIDLVATPWLHWSWKTDAPYAGLEERSRRGDDFIARIYVVRESLLTPWRSMALNYVWSGSEPAGADWKNPFTSRAHMLVVRSGSAEGWQQEARNVREDFQRLFGVDLKRVSVVALMSDCDNSGRAGMAWYDDLVFTSTRSVMY